MRPNVLELVEKINRLLHPAKFQQLTKLEADLLKDYLRSLYDVLDDPGFGTAPAKTTTAPYQEDIAPLVQQQPAEESLQPEDLLIEVDKPAVEKLPIQDAEVKPAQPAVMETPITEVVAPVTQKQQKGSLNEVVKTSSSTLNEKLKTAGSEVNQKLASRPLKELIDFNKRHALITALFKGDSNAYAKAIDALDSFASFDQAEDYLLNNLATANTWNTEDQTTRMLLKLVKQRYGAA